MKGKVGKVGWFAKSKYDNPAKTSVAYIAAQNEYGNPSLNIPARPFMRPTIENKQAEWRQLAESGARAILRGTKTVEQVFEGIGLRAAGDIRKTYFRTLEPTLKLGNY